MTSITLGTTVAGEPVDHFLRRQLAGDFLLGPKTVVEAVASARTSVSAIQAQLGCGSQVAETE